MKGVTLASWPEISIKRYGPIPFLIDPYIPKESIIFLFGDTSIGKSPLTWELSKAIATDKGFFGLPTMKGTVLYMELDTPEVVLAPRLQLVPNPPGEVWFLIMPSGLSVPNLSGEQMEYLASVRDEIKPDIVFLNTLRKLHDMDDKDSRAPKLVYSFFQQLFPSTSLVFISHNRKISLDPKHVENSKEAFSGSKHWLDDAQVGLHLRVWNSKTEKSNLMLYHVKSQASELIKPLPLLLHRDGTTLTSPKYDRLLAAYELLSEGELSKGEMDIALATRFDLGVSTAKRDRLMVEHRLFPGTRAFMCQEDEEE